MTKRKPTNGRRQVTTTLGEEAVELLPERALYWPGGSALVIADPHFGKVASFQHRGVPIPAGVMAADLARLDSALAWTGARRLVILGDFFHTAASQAESVLHALARWREQHADLQIDLIPGNHDRHAGAPPATLGIAHRGEGWAMGPFCCRHEPPEPPTLVGDRPGNGYVLAGHIHPAALLRDVDGSRHRFPCFWARPDGCVLPAFAGFAGGHPIRARQSDQVYVICDDVVQQVGGSSPDV